MQLKINTEKITGKDLRMLSGKSADWDYMLSIFERFALDDEGNPVAPDQAREYVEAMTFGEIIDTMTDIVEGLEADVFQAPEGGAARVVALLITEAGHVDRTRAQQVAAH